MTDPRTPKTDASNVEAIYPLTPLQHGMVVAALEAPEGRAYVEQLALTLEGGLDVARLEHAWRSAIERHAALRTSFVWRRGERPMQVVHKSVAFAIERTDLAGVEELLGRERARPLDLAKAPLSRVVVASRSDGLRHVLVWTHHHAVLDGWSVARVLGEVLESYARAGAPAKAGGPFGGPTFKDYVAWLGKRRAPDAERFFRERLSGLTAPTSLASALPAPQRESESESESDARLPTQRTRRLSAEITTALVATARREQVTLATVVDAAWALLLARLAGTDDVLFGVTVSGRPAELEGAESIVGLCINTVPLRTKVHRDEAVGDLLARVHGELADMKPYEWTPLVDAHGWSDIPRGTPLLEGVLVVENYPAEALGERAPAGITISDVRVVEETDVRWMLVVGPGRELVLRLVADPRFVDGASAEALLDHLATLLEGIARAPRDRRVDALPIAPEAERARIEHAWNATTAPGLDRTTPLDGFLGQAHEHAERCAILGPRGERVTYAELARRAGRLAASLAQRGVRPGDRVAIAVRRSPHLVEAVLAIWLARAAFVPVDLRHPSARVAAALEDARAALLLVDEAADAAAARETLDVPVLTLAEAAASEGPPPVARPRPEDVAYVLFTSGSTGRPKGVSVRHGSVANLLESIARTIRLAPEDVWLSVTPLTFDIATLELVGPLVRGAAVALASDDELNDAFALARRVQAACPTVMQATPSTFRMLLGSGEPLALSTARLLVGGEALNAELARALRALSRAVWNVYGPTETTIWSTALEVDAAEASAPGYVAIGRPLANTAALVLDGHGELLGPGLVGDLCIAGAGVAEGYVADEAKTRAAFVGSPWGRLYRTGDRARFRDDGVLVFEGRRDAQVKLRGHRIELGEIEAHLEAHPGVRQAAVVVSGEALAAHVVGAASEAELRAWLGERVPPIMVPSRFAFSRELPRTPNGKIDRARLAATPAEEEGPSRGAPERAASPTEAIVAAAFAEVLRLEHVPLDADFFAAGGHSLLATQVLARLRKALGVELPIRALFEGRTARALGARADALRGPARPARPPLRRAEVPWEGRDAPLSFAQARLWFIDQLEPNRAFYNVPAAVRLRGPLDVVRLSAALDGIVARHAALRTTFHAAGGVPLARVESPRSVALEVVDLSALPEADRQGEARRLSYREVQRPFDLTRDLLLRVLLLRLATEDHVAVLTMHHIASDGWSVGVLIGDLVRLYDGAALPPLAVEVPDHAAWQRGSGRDAPSGERSASSPLDAQLAYWRERLAGVVPLDLPTDRPRPPIRRFRGARVPFTVDAELAAALRALARRTSSTLFMVLLAAFDVLLARLSGQTDLAVGTPVAGRLEPEVEPLVGFFVNTLVLRVDAGDDPSFVDLVGRVREAWLGAHENQELPFEQLVGALNPVRDRSRSPLFDVMFVLQNAPRPLLSATGLAFEPAEAEAETAKVDLELTMMEAEDGRLLGSFEIDRDLFDVATAEGFARALVTLLRDATRAPQERIARLRLIDAEEEAAILAASRGPRRPYVTDEGLARALEREAARAPDACAVIELDGDREVRWSYADLDRAKNRLAHALLARGVRRGEPVGLAIARSALLVACVHACLAIGAPYVPLEPDVPRARREAMAADAGVRVVLTDANETPAWKDRALAAAEILRSESVPASSPGIEVRGSDLAYVIYTSGSTGKPKGVVLEHAGLQNRLHWQQEVLALGSDEAVLHKTPYGFDVSVWELLWPFRVGARLVVAPPGAHRDPDALVALIDRHAVTTAHFVPSMLAAFMQAEGLERLSSLARIVASGEALPLDLVLRVRARLPRVAIHNLYGPTEASIDVTHFAVPEGAVASIPIGRPIANTSVYVTDPHGRLAPRGAAGELWIGGIQVARGYLGDEARTREAFGDDPFTPGQRIYRTGDLARLRHDGQIAFLGRRDGQVKIRGHRVELGEIEQAIRDEPWIRDAAVVVAPPASSGGEARLVAYVVPRPNEEPSPARDAAHVEGWRTVFASTYGAAGEHDETLDLRGWTSSYDGQPIPEPEMRAWVDATVARIEAAAPRRVLEIGCGTGLLLFRLAPRVERYVGLDIVEGTVARVAARARQRGLANVAVFAAAADDLACVERESFDAVVLNSVVQYFPDPAYLVRVLEAAAAHMPDGGTLFVGDVRHAGLTSTLATAIELARAPGPQPLASLARAAAARAAEDEELVIDPRFFHRLADPASGTALSSRVREVRVAPKRGFAENELTAFRYDVTLRLGPLDRAPLGAPASRGADECALHADDAEEIPLHALRAFGLEALRDAVGARGDRPLVITGIPNTRVARERAAEARLAEACAGASPLRTAGDLRTSLDGAPVRGFDPDELEAVRPGARVTWDLDDAGALRLEIGATPPPRPTGALASYASRPAHVVRSSVVGQKLRERLRQALPEVMVPSAYVVIDALPLTASGKLDRARLPEPLAPARDAAGTAPPATPDEAAVAAAFSEILGVERVGRDASFFDLGGHSLLATRLVARLDARFGRRLALRDVFEAKTVAAIAKVVERAGASGAEEGIAHTDDPVAPLSHAQERLWFLEQLAPGLPTANVPAAVRIEGRLDVRALERSLADVLQRHAALRVRIEERDGAPVQRAERASGFALARTDLSGLSEDVRREAALAACTEEARTPFDLGRGPLLRARLLRLAETDHVLCVTTHHIASDRWSLHLLVREIGALYRHHATTTDGPPPLAPLAVDYLDYARWQRAEGRRAATDALVARVRQRLHGAPEVIALPTDRPRRAPRTAAGLRHAEALPPAVGALVEDFARRAGTTPFTVFAAALAALLARYGAGEDVVLGTATAGRTRSELEPLAGMFVSTVPLRLRVPEGVAMSALVARAHEEILEAFACEEAPFERVVDALAPARSLSHEPVVQVMLVLQNGPDAPLVLPDARLTLLDASTGTSKLDMTVFLEPIPGSPGAYAMSIEASRDLFEPETVARVARAFVTLLREALARPEAPVDDALLVDARESAELLELARGPEVAPPAESVEKSIAARAAREPGAVALADGTTLGELVGTARAIARELEERGVVRGDRVVIALDRGREAVAAILGVLLAGAAYVPVPPGTPEARRAAILADARPHAIVLHGRAAWPLPEGVAAVDVANVHAGAAVIDGDRAPGAARDPAGLTASAERATGDDLAYVLYTSGSTGVPKGVAVTRRALANHMAWLARAYPVGPTDTVLARTPLTFDASVWEPLLPLLTGARLAIAPAGAEADPEALVRLATGANVTVLQAVPTVLRALVQAGALEQMRSLRRIFAGGEALTTELRDAILAAMPGVELVNLYGPTEATIDATHHLCAPEDGAVIPIGRPIDGARAYVLDARGRLAPRGAPGELHLAGACLARGYWNDAERTKDRFVDDPFVPGERMYRTGDRVRIAGDGTLVYLGRDDDQVKLGGVRIELGEIEAALAAHPAVRAAAAVVRDVADEPPRLVGYVLTDDGEVPGDLRSLLAARLPGAAIPAQFVAVEDLPRTPSGKLDRKRLPAPPRPTETPARVEPSGAVEQALARVYADVLSLAAVDVTADFFELGGDSITSLQVVARARSAGITIAPRDVFEARTVRALAVRARVAENIARARRSVEDGGLLPLSPPQALLTALAPEAPHHFNQAALVEVPADLDADALRLAVVALVQRHEALRVRIVTTASGPRQRIEPASAAEAFAAAATRRVALPGPEAVADAAASVQGELDFAAGPLFRVVHFDLGKTQPGRVLLVFHHFIVDTVSWRTVEEDLLSAYAQARAGVPSPRLPLPSATLHDHAAWLARAAEDAELAREEDFWRAQTSASRPLPRDGDATPTEATARTTTITLDREVTRALTVDLKARTGLPVDALLLAPVLRALAEDTGERAFTVALESHGRALGDLDLSRVVGWFTALYPLRFEVDPDAAPLATARACAAALHRVPRGGIGYGILEGVRGARTSLPEIGWNFLGRRSRSGHAGFAAARESTGPLRSPRARRLFVLEILGVVEDDALSLSFVASEGVHHASRIERLAARTLEGLRALASGAETSRAASAAQVDASEAGLDERELARVLGKLGRRK